MAIRKKTLILVGTAFIVFIAALTTVSYYLVTDRFEQIERKDVAAHVRNVHHELGRILNNLESICADWAPGDDTYQFIDDHNTDYLQRNLVDSTFINLRLNFMIFFNNGGIPVYHRLFAFQADASAIHPAELFGAIAKHPALLAHTTSNSHISGVLLVKSSAYLIAAHPILTSEFKGPSRGTLIIGRALDAAEIERVRTAAQTALEIYPLKGSSLKVSTDRILALPKDGVMVEPISRDTIAGYSIIEDLDGSPALILETMHDRDFYRQGFLTWQHNVIAMLVFGLAFIVLLMVLLDHAILNRLADLTHQVDDISFSGRHHDRIEISANDEFGRLGHSINTMLESIHRYHNLQIDGERFLRQLLDSISCGVMVVDIEERRIVDVNAAGAELFERRRDDIIGKICHRFVCPKEMGNCPVIDHHQTIDLSKRKLLKPDGSILPILKSVASIKRHGRTFLVESFIDISNLKKAEADLRESEERYRQFFEQDITGDSLTAVDGHIIACNPAFARIFGYDSVEEAMTVNVETFYPSKNQRQMILDRLRKEKKLEGVELEFVHRNKRPLYTIGNLVGHFDEQGSLQQISAYFFDDTERVLLEKNLRQAHKMEAIGTLAGGIAHDFNNILSGVMGYTEIALLGLSATDQTAEHLHKVLKAAMRAKELVQQILTFSRQTESENRPVKLKPIIDEVLNLMRASLPATIEIRQHNTSNATVVADPVQIHQVIMNLCANAGHAMKSNGGRLSITVEETTFTRLFDDHHQNVPPGNYVCIGIEDTGKGIPKDIIDRIFDPFFSTKGKSEGTGLGLSVVHGIVSTLGGTIVVASSPQGTRFDVYLPRIEELSEASHQDTLPVSNGAESIVVIDDEDFQVDISSRMLQSFGYRVTGFTSSANAMEYILAHPDEIDLVITDMTMPHMTGAKLADRLLEALPDLRIIVCTGYSEQLTAETAVPKGFRKYIQKPFDMAELARAVRAALDEDPR